MLELPLAREMTRYLHEHIPLSRAMGAAVDSFDGSTVVLSAPLEPNINHRETVFGGSAYCLAVLAGWSVLHFRLRVQQVAARVVIQQGCMEYLKPMDEIFCATCRLPQAEDWEKFLRTFARKGRARLRLNALLSCRDEETGRFEGGFVALKAE
jgi:thioesterase domain-containing protein